MFWGLIFAGAALGIAAAAYLIGAALPREHAASARIRLAAKPDAVWALIADVAGAKDWRAELQSVEILPAIDGKAAWRETSKFGAIVYQLVEDDPPRRRRMRIADASLPYGGEWEYTLAPLDGGCELTITERGFVKPPIFRFLSRFVFGYTATIASVERSLAKKLGETAAPAIVLPEN